jgi:putative membrane protein
LGQQPGTVQQAQITDADIAAIASTIHKAEVAEALLAKVRAVSPDVRSFAMEMVTSHGNALQQGQAMMQKSQIVPNEANPTNQQIRMETQETIDVLQTKTGKDFDKAYIESQISNHQNVLRMLDEELIPNAQSPQLRMQLMQLRPHVEAHLKNAQEIQSKLSMTGAPPTGQRPVPPTMAPAPAPVPNPPVPQPKKKGPGDPDQQQ